VTSLRRYCDYLFGTLQQSALALIAARPPPGAAPPSHPASAAARKTTASAGARGGGAGAGGKARGAGKRAAGGRGAEPAACDLLVEEARSRALTLRGKGALGTVQASTRPVG